MNKIAKGAIATGVGIILLAGGGGTLATWNQAQNASMGSVVSGDLNLVPVKDSAKWTNASGATVDVAKYKVVPGDVLTYTQELDMTLEGDLMVAKLEVTGAGVDNGFKDNATLSTTTLTGKAGKIAATDALTPANDGIVTASTTFTFKSTTDLRDAVNTSYNLTGIGYKLVQQAPDTTKVP